MDSDTRIKVRRERDAAVRRSLGLGAATRSRSEGGSKARRWTDAEIVAAVRLVSKGKPITRHAYKVARRDFDPNDAPSHNTVYARRPDLFTTT